MTIKYMGITQCNVLILITGLVLTSAGSPHSIIKLTDSNPGI